MRAVLNRYGKEERYGREEEGRTLMFEDAVDFKATASSGIVSSKLQYGRRRKEEEGGRRRKKEEGGGAVSCGVQDGCGIMPRLLHLRTTLGTKRCF